MNWRAPQRLVGIVDQLPSEPSVKVSPHETAYTIPSSHERGHSKGVSTRAPLGEPMEMRTGARVNKASLIGAWPRRHVVVGLTFLGCVYTDRVNISSAAVAMKEHFGWS